MFWRLNIDNLKRIYEINEYGVIRNRKTAKIRKPHMDKDGYMNIVLYDIDDSRKNYKVHRLVAMVFIPEFDENRNFVNHKDGNRSNNYYTNLEWVTPQENSTHSITEGKYYKDNKEQFDFVEKIAIMLSKGNTTTEIMQRLGIEGAKKNPRYVPTVKIIHGLRTGRTYRNLHDKYIKKGSTTIETPTVMEFIPWDGVE